MRKAINRLLPEMYFQSRVFLTELGYKVLRHEVAAFAYHKFNRQTAPAQRIGICLVGRGTRGKDLSSKLSKKWRNFVAHVSLILHVLGVRTSLPAMDIALFQPDQPQNTGTLLRLGACMNTPVHVIEPCGFPFSHRALKRSAMDYADLVTLHHHLDWDGFVEWVKDHDRRLVLLTTKADAAYAEFTFEDRDILLVGSESTGAPDFVHDTADARVTIPMNQKARSINVAVSMGMVLGEALRQTDSWPT